MPETLELRYQVILERIEQAYQRTELSRGSSQASFNKPVTLIAVSKGQSVDAIETLYRLGHRDFGENYVQELLKKDEELQARGCREIRWHFIGHLQTNKVKALISKISCLHTVDSERLVEELVKRWKSVGAGKGLPVFIEVNIGEEPSKEGLLPASVIPFIQKISRFPELQIQGLMCIPPTGGEPREWFRRLRELEAQCRPISLGSLSMGMSNDFEMAILEGATHVRVGTALFGPRKTQRD